ncbi:hypothetical protein A0H81_07637 [Grifola frondosa]|uniref:Uncharacterized protein n=1 Tax=Grifola frondosa TaxID=5627 RepID=A0A1C7M706_GRIFR|nr:hypothetical protein A0H81_07637 [Grifola frondosa]
MSLFTNIVGFSLFGLAARFGQLGIQKRNLLKVRVDSTSLERLPRSVPYSPDFSGHVIAMGSFGFLGYWAYQWDQRAAVLLAEKRAEIAERRQRKAAAVGSE